MIYFWRTYLFSLFLFAGVTGGLFSRPHHNLIIVSDDDSVEQLDGALTQTLAAAIDAHTSPILASASILFNYVYENQVAVDFLGLTWDLYSIKVSVESSELTSYCLLLPVQQGASDNSIESFGFTPEVLVPFHDSSRCNRGALVAALRLIIDENKGFESHFWEELFRSKDIDLEGIWSFLFFSHGTLRTAGDRVEADISGLNDSTLRSFLYFIGDELNANVVGLTACFLAGKLRNRIFCDQGSNAQLGYHIFVQGFADTAVSLSTRDVTEYGQQILSFFKEASKLEPDCQGAVESLAHAFSSMAYATYTLGAINYPLIRFAGATQFTHVPPKNKNTVHLCTPSKDLTPSKKTPIAQLYATPEHLTAPAVVVPRTQAFMRTLCFDPLSSVMPSLSPVSLPIDLLDYLISMLLDETMSLSQNEYPAVNYALEEIKELLKGTELLRQVSELCTLEDEISKNAQKKILRDSLTAKFNALKVFNFPAVISASNSGYIAFCRKYVGNQLQNGRKTPFCGILKFIKDAFFSLGKVGSEKNICIDVLEGYNDLSLLFELQRIDKDDTGNQDLERCLSRYTGEFITLNKFHIKHDTDPTSRKPRYTVSFAFFDQLAWLKDFETTHSGWSAWQWSFSEGHFADGEKIYWDFKRIDYAQYLKSYQKIRSRSSVILDDRIQGA